jgi:hypothetical protein
MSPTLRARVLLALGAAPALVAGACLPTTQTLGGDVDDDEDEDGEAGGGSAGAGSGWGAQVDHDGDGYPVGEDCNDSDAAISPGSVEWCNGVDDDCDLEVDEGLDEYPAYPDADGDGYGTTAGAVMACAAPTGHVWQAGDCDDGDPSVHPAAAEVCDGADNDCEGSVDRIAAWVDADGDGWAGTRSTRDACDPLPDGVSETRDDCDDADPTISPDAAEVCGNAIDDDCSGSASCLVMSFGSDDAADPECVYAWQAEYLESWSEVCEGCSFPAYGSWVPTGEWREGPTCATPNGQWLELYVTPLSVQDPWGYSLDELEWSATRVGFAGEWGSAGSVDWVEVEGELMLSEIGYVGAGGRPFTVEGRPRTAAPGDADGWRRARTALPAPEPLRPRIAAHWAEAGRLEHASVASFARFALELLALGAPADLLARTSAAMADEIDHARRCFGMAAAHGLPAGVGALPVAGALRAAGDPGATLRALIQEGCIGETLAAAEAEAAAQQAVDPAARATLRIIAEDESRHAALAWAAARWLLSAHPSLAGEAARIFEAAAPRGPLPTPGPDAPALALARHGVLDAHARARVARRAWAEVLAPARQLLLSPRPEAHA